MALFDGRTQFRIVIDGTPVPGTNVESSFNTSDDRQVSAIIAQKVAVAAGAHTVVLQWRNGGGGTAHCRPGAFPDVESATLFVSEVAP